MMKKLLSTAAVGALALAAPVGAVRAAPSQNGIEHVLLISIDGMHSDDYINCATDKTDVNGNASYCPTLANLKSKSVNFLDASTSKPSDSFPGLMAMVSGATPRTMGVYYDVAYDRVLAPPAKTTGNGVAAGACNKNVANGTTTEYEEGIDLDQTKLNGGAGDGGIASIDPSKLPRDPYNKCAPVYPWNFVRMNTIFGVIHQNGGYTAWTDKHPAYSSVSGPADPSAPNLDDYYAPEINSIPVALPGVTVAGSGVSCAPLPDQTAVSSSNAYTDSFQNIQCYDQLKVNAVLNQINRKTHDGTKAAPVPTIFGMNFQSVSVGQKLIQKSTGVKGGYLSNEGAPSDALFNEIKFVDAAIAQMIAALKKSNVYDSTLIVITAKHGQSPMDSSRYTAMKSGSPVTTSPATILSNAGCLPYSESTNNANGIGPTEDDISLIWLSSSCDASTAAAMLESASPATSNVAGIGQIFSGPAVTQMFGQPGVPPKGDSRTPDLVITPNVGVTYSGSSKKQAEHGGFSHDDTNVMLLVSNPNLMAGTVTVPVGTLQVAPTILKALGLNPSLLQGVQQEGTQVLPHVFN